MNTFDICIEQDRIYFDLENLYKSDVGEIVQAEDGTLYVPLRVLLMIREMIAQGMALQDVVITTPDRKMT